MPHDGSSSSSELAPEMLSSAARALLEWRPDGVVVRWNPGAERIFGYLPDEALGRDLRDLIGEVPTFSEPSRKRLDGARRRTETTETQGTTKEGRSIRCRWMGTVLRDAAGEPRIVIAEVDDIADRERAFELFRASHELLRMVLDNAVSLVFVKDLERRYIFVNEAMADAFGRHPMEFIGKTDLELGIAPPELESEWAAKDTEIIEGGRPVRFEEAVPVGSETRYFLTVKFPIHDASGKAVALCGIPTDITSLKRAEAERTALQEQIIASQEAALRELQTPLMPIADQVLAMPIVGAVDAARAAQIMETLLKGITAMRAHTAILDITGVRGINAEVAEALVRTARAARLLGARVVLTGIGPAVASALIELRVDIEGIVTRGTFQSGIAYALAGERA
jgi:PAS domain S-box-containing protein